MISNDGFFVLTRMRMLFLVTVCLFVVCASRLYLSCECTSPLHSTAVSVVGTDASGGFEGPVSKEI